MKTKIIFLMILIFFGTHQNIVGMQPQFVNHQPPTLTQKFRQVVNSLIKTHSPSTNLLLTLFDTLTPEEWTTVPDDKNNHYLARLVRIAHTFPNNIFNNSEAFLLFSINHLVERFPRFVTPDGSLWNKNNYGEDLIHMAARRSMFKTVHCLLALRCKTAPNTFQEYLATPQENGLLIHKISPEAQKEIPTQRSSESLGVNNGYLQYYLESLFEQYGIKTTYHSTPVQEEENVAPAAAAVAFASPPEEKNQMHLPPYAQTTEQNIGYAYRDRQAIVYVDQNFHIWFYSYDGLFIKYNPPCEYVYDEINNIYRYYYLQNGQRQFLVPCDSSLNIILPTP